MPTTTEVQPIPFLRGEGERVERFRISVDPSTNERLAADLVARAEALGLPELPEADRRRSYDACVAQVLSSCAVSYHGHQRAGGFDSWMAGRIARRMFTHGDCLWHAIWVVGGKADGTGCDCSPCRNQVEG